MFEFLFSNLIRSSTSTGGFDTVGLLISFAIALLTGLILAFCYLRQGGGTKNFAMALVLLPSIVAMMILMVSGNLGAGVAVAGTFGLIRFRSAKGSAKDIMLIFLGTAAGIACGMGYAFVGLLFTLLLCAVFLILALTRFGEHSGSNYRELRIMLPENIDYSTVFEDIFQEYTLSATQVRVRTTNLGSMFDITYDVRLKDTKKEKEFLDALRTRNGNLTIVCGRSATNAEYM